MRWWWRWSRESRVVSATAAVVASATATVAATATATAAATANARLHCSRHFARFSTTTAATAAATPATVATPCTRRYGHALILDGRASAHRVLDELRTRWHALQRDLDSTAPPQPAHANAAPLAAAQPHSLVPGLAIVTVGDRRDSRRYIETKQKAAHELGFHVAVHAFAHDASAQQVHACIDALNRDLHVHGIIVQLPLPAQIDTHAVLNAVTPVKDVDGFHALNMGALALHGTTREAASPPFFHTPCTPKGCLRLLHMYDLPVRGRHVVILGRSPVVGLPLTLLFLHEHAMVTNCDEHTPVDVCRRACAEADIVVSAIGKPRFLTREWIKRGAIVLDIGINFIRRSSPEPVREDENPLDIQDGVLLVGDVDYDAVVVNSGGDDDLGSAPTSHVSAITPVPGGVGPMTVAMLMENTLNAYAHLHHRAHSHPDPQR